MNSSNPLKKVSGTRRRILAWGSLGAMAALAGNLAWPQKKKDAETKLSKAQPKSGAGKSAHGAPAKALTGRDVFLPHLDSTFLLEYAPLRTTECKLIEIGDRQDMHSRKLKFTSYSLVFTAPKIFEPESQVYRLQHEQLGTMDLFLSPFGRARDCIYLEAIISQQA